jgi:lipid-A-disaccharide synthase
MNNKFFVSCGEMSGDLHLSYIIKALKRLDSSAEFYGMAGDKSASEGAVLVQHIKDNDIMGFAEAVKKYKYFKQKAIEYIDFIRKNDIKNVIFVDYGGFNLRFFEMLKKEINDIRTFYYIPPKVWAWGEKRIEKLKKVDEVIVIFPWEKDYYDKKNMKVSYFGNPFIDKYEFTEEYGKKILLLPGSRKQEILKILPVMLDLVKEKKEEKFILRLADESHLGYFPFNREDYPNMEISFSKLEDIRKEFRMAVATSGTVTFEMALMGLPVIVGYITSSLNVFIARKILKITYISLTNIGAGKEVLPELIQKDFNVKNIEKKMNYIDNSKKTVLESLRESRNLMGEKGVTNRISQFILERAL